MSSHYSRTIPQEWHKAVRSWLLSAPARFLVAEVIGGPLAPLGALESYRPHALWVGRILQEAGCLRIDKRSQRSLPTFHLDQAEYSRPAALRAPTPRKPQPKRNHVPEDWYTAVRAWLQTAPDEFSYKEVWAGPLGFESRNWGEYERKPIHTIGRCLRGLGCQKFQRRNNSLWCRPDLAVEYRQRLSPGGQIRAPHLDPQDDPWTFAIEEWLRTAPERFYAEDAFRDALHATRDYTQEDARRLCASLRLLGAARAPYRGGPYEWIRPQTETPPKLEPTLTRCMPNRKKRTIAVLAWSRQ